MVHRPYKHRRPSRERASILVVCMVLAALGTIGVAAWFSLLDARSQQVEAGIQALQRRTMLTNGQAVAHASLYRTYLHGNTDLPSDLVHTISGGNGRATLRSFTGVPLKSTVEGPPSRDGVRPFSSYSTSVSVDLYDGIGETRWTYRLRSHNPMLEGDLLDLHSPVNPSDTAPLVSGNLRIKGRAVIWDAVARDFNNGLRADEYLLPNSIAGTTTFTNTAGTATLPLNAPHFLRTTGSQSSSSGLYRGEIELLDTSQNPQNSYLNRLGSSPTVLDGSIASTISNGPPTIDPTPDDPALLAYISANSPSDVAATLSGYSNLSSSVLSAAVQKVPALNNSQLHQVFNAQSSPPNDALTQMMAAIDESTLTPALDNAIIDFNISKGSDYNVNGSGTVTVYLDQVGIERVLATNVSRLRLVGQRDATSGGTAATHPPLLLVVDNRSGGTLNRVDFIHENSRPLILVLASSSASLPSAYFLGNSAFPLWRGILELQKTGLAFDLSAVSGATITGGIRGNHRLTVTGGTLTLQKETDGSALRPLLSRDAWIETIRN